MKILFVALMLIALGAGPLGAESVLFKSGRILEGEVIEKTDRYIKVDTGDGVFKVPFNMMDDEFAAYFKEFPAMEQKAAPPPVVYKGKTIRKEGIVAQDVLARVAERYKNLTALSCYGVGISTTMTRGANNTAQQYLSVRLQRPGYYLVIEETTDAAQQMVRRAAWDDGAAHYYDSLLNTQTDYPTDDLAWLGINDVKVLYDLFFGCENGCSAWDKVNYFGSTDLNGEPCYLFQKSVYKGSYMFWISQTRDLIVRIDYGFEGDVNEFLVRQLSMDQIEAAFAALGVEQNNDNEARFRNLIEKAYPFKKNQPTETYSEIIFDNMEFDQEEGPEAFSLRGSPVTRPR